MAPAAARRPATPAPAPGVAFGRLSFYMAGGGLPEGDYCLFFDVRMYQSTDQNGVARGKPRLGVMLTAHDLSNIEEEPKSKFLSMGSKADLSFAPDPNDNKKIVQVPGAAAPGTTDKSNWVLFLKSLYDCGMPDGAFEDSLATIDGVHVHIANVPEPEERKAFKRQAATGEAAMDGGSDQPQGPTTIPVVTEIKEDGKPWEGTGGLPDAPAKPAATPAKGATPAKPAAARSGAHPAPAAPAADVDGDEDLMTTAVNAITDIIVANTPDGGGELALPKLKLRTETFKALTAKGGAPLANSVINTYFAKDDALNGILNQLGYTVVGNQIKQQ